MTNHTNRLSPGAAEAAHDNPDVIGIVLALAAAPDAAPAELNTADELRAILRRRAIVRRTLGALALPAAAAAAAIVAAAALPETAGGGRRAAPPAEVKTGATTMVAATTTAAAATMTAAATMANTGAGAARAQNETLLARQRPDGSWRPDRGGAALAPAATGLAVLRLLESGEATNPKIADALDRAAQWLRSNQNADGSFGAAASADSGRPTDIWNLALATAAVLRLYEGGNHPELFTPADGAISAVRRSLMRRETETRPLAGRGAEERDPSPWLAAALAKAGALEWPNQAPTEKTAPSLEALLSDRRFPAGA